MSAPTRSDAHFAHVREQLDKLHHVRKRVHDHHHRAAQAAAVEAAARDQQREQQDAGQ